MKIRMMLSALLPALGLAFAAGCFCCETPDDVAHKAIDAFKRGDYAAIIDMSSGKAQEEMKKNAAEIVEIKAKAARGDQKARKIMALFDNMSFILKDAKVEGDYATVDVTMIVDKDRRDDKMYLKKIDGKWKLVDKADYKPAD